MIGSRSNLRPENRKRAPGTEISYVGLTLNRLTKYSYFIKISYPTVMLPEQLAQNITSMLQVDLQDLQLSHTSEEGKPIEHSKISLNGLGLKFKTMETVGNKFKVLQSSTVPLDWFVLILRFYNL